MEIILLVEDTYDLSQAVKKELEISGYRVLHAIDGSSALGLQVEERPALIILDWMLPGMDGLEVLRRVRQTATTPVLMLTARTEEIDRVIGLELGADDYLTKPFSMRELIARVKALFRRAELIRQTLQADQGGNNKILSYKTLQLNPERHQATLEGMQLELGATEFSLLQLLLRNPGRAFHRNYLLDTVWGENFDGNERTVDTAILRLRKKLGSIGETIETIWGVGYRWRADREEK